MSYVPPHGDSIAGAAQEALVAIQNVAIPNESTPGAIEVGKVTSKQNSEKERLERWMSEQNVASGKLDHRLRDSSQLRDRVLSLLAKIRGEILI
jgi:hypothetical protein